MDNKEMLYTGDQIYANYLSLMSDSFNDYIRDYTSVDRLRDRHRESRDRCSGYLIEQDFRTDINSRLDRDFQRFLDYCQHYKKCLGHFTDQLVKFARCSDRYYDRSELVRECGRLIPETYMAFDQNIPYFDGPDDSGSTTGLIVSAVPVNNDNDYGFQVFGYDFRQLLNQHIDQHIRRYESCSDYLRQAIERYEPSLKDEYRGRRQQYCWRQWLNSSNEWLSADNYVYFMTHRELDDRCQEFWHRFGQVFQQRLNRDTRQVLARDYYRPAYRRENYTAGLVLTVAAIGALIAYYYYYSYNNGDVDADNADNQVVVLVVSIVMTLLALLAIVYFIVRKLSRPHNIRQSIHDPI